jgi:intracellular multiplication protein IcmW
MPDLSRLGVHTFWHDYDRRVLYRIVASIEAVEVWAVDNDEHIDQALIYLGESLEGISHSDIEFHDEAKVVKLLASIHAGRALRLMQFLDMKKPGTASKLLVYAEESTKDKSDKDVFADMFLKRNLSFERLQLLSRVFAPERIKLLLNALEMSHE